MASIQSEKANHQIQNTTYLHLQKPTLTNEPRRNSHEHSLSDKVKDMAQSARKLFHHHHHHEPDHTQKPTCNCSSSCGVNKKKKKEKRVVKNPEVDRVKKLKNKEHKCSDCSSDSDNEITKNKK